MDKEIIFGSQEKSEDGLNIVGKIMGPHTYSWTDSQADKLVAMSHDGLTAVTVGRN